MSDNNKDVEIKKDVQEEITADTQDNKELDKEAEVKAETQEETATETKEDKKDEKVSKLKKHKKKDKRDEQIEELKDKLVRSMAEFDNYRKRTEKEKSQMFEIGAKSIVEKILPVVDNFERALDAATDDEKETPFVQGVDKIYKHMITSLEEVGVKAIDAQGKEFDPNLHNAVMHVEDEDMDENVVAEELQKGYMYKESVVRHSMVKVAN
ncbi:MAG: nucleotide exchange factor GrpE [Lachnospiraceae bacterium]|nr:nucleotide exchange factor GrpE [Lachnospiraceae bacterium]